MLSERREAVWVKACWVEILGLWALARHPANRIPIETVARMQREYFRWRLEEAIVGLCAGSEPLAEVLTEILLIADGTDPIVNWQPLVIEEMLTKLTEPLTSKT